MTNTGFYDYYYHIMGNGIEINRRTVMESVVSKFKNTGKKRITTMERLMAIDSGYKEIIEEAEKYWLSEANKILSEIITEIRNRIADPETTMADLVKALDTISNKYNLSMGQPTSFDLNLSIVKNMKDEELDNRINELQSQFISLPEEIPKEIPLSTPLGNPSLIRKSDKEREWK